MLTNARKRRPGADYAGIKVSQLRVIPGNIAANLEHMQGLLAKAGMTDAQMDALCEAAGARSIVQQACALRCELHDRGILLLPGRIAPKEEKAMCAELETVLSDAASLVNTLSAALPGAALAPALKVLAGQAGIAAPASAAVTVDALRAELATLAGNDTARRSAIVKTIRQLQAGTYQQDQANAGSAAALRAELETLSGHDDASSRRKAVICKALRTLRVR
jgi:hypothetical protein